MEMAIVEAGVWNIKFYYLSMDQQMVKILLCNQDLLAPNCFSYFLKKTNSETCPKGHL